MKKTPYALLAAAFLFLLGSCEKENPNPGSKKPGSPAVTEKAAPTVSVTVSSSCGARVCSIAEVMPNPPKYNMLTMTKAAGPSSLTYSLYERTSDFWFGGNHFETYTRYAQFPCNLTITQYASGLVNNGALTLVCSTDLTNSPTLPGTTLNLANGVIISPPADTDFDFVTAGNEEGGQGCGISND
jgi:hypothetical protein